MGDREAFDTKIELNNQVAVNLRELNLTNINLKNWNLINSQIYS